MLKLAAQYATLLKTEIISYRNVDATTISFVMASGPKLLMTEDELTQKIEELQPEPPAKAEKPKAAKAEKEK